MATRTMKWLGGSVALLLIVVVAVASISNWNWFKKPLSRYVADKTGRELRIDGDLVVHLGWPDTRIETSGLSFSNPDWARNRQLLRVSRLGFDLAMPPLLARKLVVSSVTLDNAAVDLEKSADGRKNWLLDRKQSDENSSVTIRRLTVTRSTLGYFEPAKKTDIQAEFSTAVRPLDPRVPLVFHAHGRYEGQALDVRGRGGSLLALREQRLPYPLNIAGAIGPTRASAQGTITNLLQFSALDLQIDVRGGSLAELYPLVGVVLPDTPPYRTRGRLLREGRVWRYDRFSGQIGKSDIAGSMKIDTGGERPLLSGALRSKNLNLADLGPLVGTASPSQPGQSAARPGAVLPDTPFRTERWNRMDADVRLQAGAIVRDKALPINDLDTHLQLRNARLTLDPLRFGIAGGSLGGAIRLDGSQDPIRAAVDLKARKIHLSRLFPTLDLTKTSIGLINGDVDLKGTGNSVAQMLGRADGRLALVVDGGEISKLMMEAVGVHVLEILQLTLTGDKNIRIRCGIADLGVKRGVVYPRVLLLDTDITQVNVAGTIDLGAETLDLTVTQHTKKLSLVSLRPPIHVRGSFAKPDVAVDKTRLAARGLGAVALGAVNPLLALLPLIETGPGKDSECGRLIRQARAPAKP